MEKLKKLCEAALSSGVRVTRENLFDLARFGSYSNWKSLKNICIKLKCLINHWKLFLTDQMHIVQMFDKSSTIIFGFLVRLQPLHKSHMSTKISFLAHLQACIFCKYIVQKYIIYYIVWHTCRLAGEFSCLQPAAGNLLTKCSKFLRSVITMMRTMMMPLLFKIFSTLNTAHLYPGKNCPKTLGSFATLIGKTLRHSRCFLSFKSCPIYYHIFLSSLQN